MQLHYAQLHASKFSLVRHLFAPIIIYMTSFSKICIQISLKIRWRTSFASSAEWPLRFRTNSFKMYIYRLFMQLHEWNGFYRFFWPVIQVLRVLHFFLKVLQSLWYTFRSMNLPQTNLNNDSSWIRKYCKHTVNFMVQNYRCEGVI